MPIQPTAKIWMNGDLVDWDQAKVHVLTHTLHYGTGVFEGIRAYETADGAAVFRLTDHIVRLENSARILMMDLPYSVPDCLPASLPLPGSKTLITGGSGKGEQVRNPRRIAKVPRAAHVGSRPPRSTGVSASRARSSPQQSTE